MYWAFVEARNKHNFATSSGLPTCLTGIKSSINFLNFFGFLFFSLSHPVFLINIGPGETELKVIFFL